MFHFLFKLQTNIKTIIIMPLTIAAIGGAVNLGVTAFRGMNASNEKNKQQARLDTLSATALPKFKVSDEINSIYGQASSEALNPMGFSGAEKNAFNQNISQNYNTQFYNAVNRTGGQTGRFANAVLSGNNINAMNTFASNDASLARQNRMAALSRMMSGANTIQGVENANSQAEIQRRLMTEQALGGAVAQQNQNIDQAWKSVGDLGAMGAGYALSGYGGVDKVKKIDTSGNIFNGNYGFSKPKGQFDNLKIVVPSTTNKVQNPFSFPNIQDMTYNAKTGRYE
jgi:hypothetical protein